MELLRAIHERRTVKDFTAQSVPDEFLLRVLEAGLWAQNHRLSQPWRFAVFGAQSKAHLAGYFPRAVGIPAVVAVTCLKNSDAEVEREDYAACACAIQNIQLAAWDAGLGMQWSSGRAAFDARTAEMLELDGESEMLVGLLFFGFPAEIPPAKARRGLDEVLRRLD